MHNMHLFLFQTRVSMGTHYTYTLRRETRVRRRRLIPMNHRTCGRAVLTNLGKMQVVTGYRSGVQRSATRFRMYITTRFVQPRCVVGTRRVELKIYNVIKLNLKKKNTNTY